MGPAQRLNHIPMIMNVLRKITSHRIRRYGFVLGVIFLISPRLVTASFDWPATPGWTAGVPGPGQTASQNFTRAQTNGIVVAINNSGAGVQGMVWEGSQAAGGFITVTVSGGAVNNLSFQISEGDAIAARAIDRITNIQAIALGGGNIGPDSVTSAVPAFNTINGNGLGLAVVRNGNASDSTNEGSIDIVFSGPLTQYSFQLDNNDPASGSQATGLGSLTYTPAPEIDPSWIAAATCVVAAGLKLVRGRTPRSLVRPA